MIKSDGWIKRMAVSHKMIEPFSDAQVSKGVVSFGVSSYGYDMRVSNRFRIYKPSGDAVVDPKRFNDAAFTDVIAEEFVVLPPHSYALAQSVEYLRIPRNIITIAFGKSTYARCGILVNLTPFEPEWEGFVTIAISNTTNCPAKVYVNEGIAQVLFLQADELCEVSYADKKGKYQSQNSITSPKIQ